MLDLSKFKYVVCDSCKKLVAEQWSEEIYDAGQDIVTNICKGCKHGTYDKEKATKGFGQAASV